MATTAFLQKHKSVSEVANGREATRRVTSHDISGLPGDYLLETLFHIWLARCVNQLTNVPVHYYTVSYGSIVIASECYDATLLTFMRHSVSHEVNNIAIQIVLLILDLHRLIKFFK
ncbi:hypothetical protein LMG28138_04855 [Pararobbsia alpina]|uniref:Uncharacterized protein n=1 Tax=Pararobbsia alpina TaxID=621374 RepID=A0A6S7BHG2_9BURK|nr:hypothetical protein LMG28138_04855 [Pararobbsia alpina]